MTGRREQQKADDRNTDYAGRRPRIPPIPGYNLEFSFSSDPLAHLASDLEWQAVLLVKAKDLPYLMKNGFHCSEANVQEGEGYFGGPEIQSSRTCDTDLWPCARVYLLKDKAERPQWEAMLYVCAREIPVLSAFKIAYLSIEKISYTVAWDQHNRYVYSFAAQSPGLNLNAYYDDKPLQGLWPWPKEGESSVPKSKSEQEESRSEQEEWDEGWLRGEEDLV